MKNLTELILLIVLNSLTLYVIRGKFWANERHNILSNLVKYYVRSDLMKPVQENNAKLNKDVFSPAVLCPPALNDWTFEASGYLFLCILTSFLWASQPRLLFKKCYSCKESTCVVVWQHHECLMSISVWQFIISRQEKMRGTWWGMWEVAGGRHAFHPTWEYVCSEHTVHVHFLHVALFLPVHNLSH